jgi:hypothetical protein
MKKVTFFAEDDLIERARMIARSQGKTLNVAFREWLQTYARPAGDPRKFESLMKRLRHVRSGRHFTRDEMNER